MEATTEASTVAASGAQRQEKAPYIRIAPSRGWVSLHLPELWEHRELLYFLTWRDIKVRYKQTALGAAWAIIQPFLTMVVFSLFFGRLAKIPSDGVPYPVFSFAALVPWTYFSNALTQAGNSMIESSRLITKVYFPRLAIPIASVLGGLVDFALAFLILLGMMLFFHLSLSWRLVFIPAFLALAVVCALGVGLWLAAWNVRYRDVRYVLPFLIQLWMFASPIAYPSSLLPAKWRLLYGLNPMAGVVEGFRWCLLGTGHGPGPLILVSALAAITIMVGGMYHFRRMEADFADLV